LEINGQNICSLITIDCHQLASIIIDFYIFWEARKKDNAFTEGVIHTTKEEFSHLLHVALL